MMHPEPPPGPVKRKPRKGWLEPTLWSITAAGLTWLATSMTLQNIERGINTQYLRKIHADTLREVANVRSGAEIAINKRVYLTRGLKAHVSVNPEIDTQEFSHFAELLLREVDGIRSATLLKNNEITAVYPLDGNESAIGFKPLEHPDQRAALAHAIQTGDPWLTGPVELHQGGKAFINRAPVYTTPFREGSGPGKYWGLVSILIDFDELVEEIESYTPQKTRIAICNPGLSEGPANQFFVGSSSILAENPITTNIALQSGSWQLYGVPVAGWPSEAPGAGFRRAVGRVTAVIAGLIAFLLVRACIGYIQSIAELRRANQESSKTRRLLEKTAHMARVGGWEYNPTTSELLWSDEICIIHDLPPGHAPSLDEAISYYTDHSRPIVANAVRRSLEDHKAWDLELQLVTAQDRSIWVRAIGEPEVVDGQCVRVWGTFQDITERHHAQEQLQLTQHAVDNSADAVFFIAQDARITYASLQAKAYLGLSPAELSQRNFFDFDRSLTSQNWHTRWTQTKQSAHSTYKSQMLRSDGSWLDCEIRTWHVQFAGQELIVATVRDIGQAKREAEMRDVLFERSSDAHLIFDSTGILQCNQAAVDMLRLDSKAELLGHHPTEFSPEYQPDGRHSLKAYHKLVTQAQDQGNLRFDWVHRRKTGQEFVCEVGLNPVALESGPALLLVWHDISERKQVEDELAASNLELQQFAYVASHDLQAPLRGIANFAQFLAEDYSQQLDTQAENYIHRIVEGCKRMQSLISDLLSYSRAPSLPRPYAQVDLNRLVDETTEVLRPYLEETGGSVTHDPLPSVKGDASQLAQLMLNLVGNGIKYHGTDAPRVSITSERHDDLIVIRVSDNGIGIPRASQQRVFEVFKRLHTQEEYPGTGIGLAICRRIVEQHAGKIWLESTPGQGSTFVFTLPQPLHQLAGKSLELQST